MRRAPRFRRRPGGLSMFLLLLAAVALLIIVPLSVSFSLFSFRYLRYARDEIANSARLSVISARRMTEMYQDTVAQAATLVLIDPALGEIASILRLDEVRRSFDAYQRLNRAVSLLTSMTYIGSLRIDSAYLYVDGADYIISSDRGPVRLADFQDQGYRDVYEMLARTPHAGIWVARKVAARTVAGDALGTAAYFTYASMANPVVSRVGGAIFVNIRETVFSDLVNAQELDKGGRTFIVDPDGVVLSHVDKSRILAGTSEGEAILRLLARSPGAIATAPGMGQKGESLYVSARSERTSWTYVAEHSLDALTTRIRGLMRVSIAVVLLITLLGSSVVVLISFRISTPLRKLILSLSQWSPGGGDRGPIPNEFEYLLESFQRIRERESALHRTIEKSRDKLWESYVVDLLRGDLDKYAEDPFPDSGLLPREGGLRVLTMSMDRRAEVESRLSHEQRFYYQSLLSAECEKAFAPRFRCAAVLIDGNVSAILGCPPEAGLVEEITPSVAELKERFAGMLGTTFSAGLSSLHAAELEDVSGAYVESLEAVSRRMIEGYGKVHVWQRPAGLEARYPSEAEERLLSCLRTGDLEGIDAALGAFFSCLDEMGYEDIVRSVDQLCAALFATMRERGIRRADAGTRALFAEVGNRDTLSEKRSLVADICRIIVLETRSGAAALVDRMLGYVAARYTTTIDFEAMAREVGVSYSYMRRLMREHTGRSILEHVHHLRIEEAGRMLDAGGTSISEIARTLGYNNIQSFERFFRKHKGVSAQEYRKTAAGPTRSPGVKIDDSDQKLP